MQINAKQSRHKSDISLKKNNQNVIFAWVSIKSNVTTAAFRTIGANLQRTRDIVTSLPVRDFWEN